LSGGDLPTQVGLTAEQIDRGNLRTAIKFHFESRAETLVVFEDERDTPVPVVRFGS
jgi:hypothetical protein